MVDLAQSDRISQIIQALKINEIHDWLTTFFFFQRTTFERDGYEDEQQSLTHSPTSIGTLDLPLRNSGKTIRQYLNLIWLPYSISRKINSRTFTAGT